MSELLLTPDELAKRWIVSPRTLERWRWLGTGPDFVKVAGKIKYKLGSVEGFENEREIKNEQ